MAFRDALFLRSNGETREGPFFFLVDFWTKGFSVASFFVQNEGFLCRMALLGGAQRVSINPPRPPDSARRNIGIFYRIPSLRLWGADLLKK